MFIILDTNIWYEQLGLRSPIGSAVRYYLRASNSSLALPEVIKLEVQKNLRSRLNGHISRMQNEYEQLHVAFGSLRKLVLPMESEVTKLVDSLFDVAGVPIIEIPFSEKSARNALLKTIDSKPPCDKSQQFKDAVVWADCVELLQQGPVTLVTKDKAFFKDRNRDKGLAENLKEEVACIPHDLTICADLDELLTSIKRPVFIEHSLIVENFLNSKRDGMESLLKPNGFLIGSSKYVNYQPFATEDPSKLFLKYSGEFVCTEAAGENRNDASLSVAAETFYYPGRQNFDHWRQTEAILRFTDAEGDNVERQIHFLFGNGGTFGHATIEKEVRYTLPPQ